jgi:hypothetical protein
LLGFVKYFWRDAVGRLSDTDKSVLKTRISSFEVSGLGLDSSRLSGNTLVTYAGSLTGRDFRVIAQIAPFVLAGLMEQDHLDAWVALSRLVTLVWRPSIDNLSVYMVHIQLITLHMIFFHIFLTIRLTSMQPSSTFSTVPAACHLNGSTNQSSTSFFTYLHTFVVLGRQ